MKILANKDWKALEDALWRSFGYPQKLLIDGYEVSIRLTISRQKMKIFIRVFVNGQAKGEWLKTGNPIGEKFYFKGKKWIVSKAEVKKAKKELGVRLAKRFGIQEKYFEYLNCDYPSFTALKRSFKASCKEITWQQ